MPKPDPSKLPVIGALLVDATSRESWYERHIVQATALHFLVLTVSGWLQRRQLAAIEYLRTENEVLREHLGDRGLRLTDAQRRRLAVKGQALGRKGLRELASIVTPETMLRWYRELIARKYDGTAKRGPGRPRKAGAIAELVQRMARENPRWGYTRIMGAMKNLGHEVGRNTVTAQCVQSASLQLAATACNDVKQR